MHLRISFAISIVLASCSSSAKPEPPSGPQAPTPPNAGTPSDAALTVATADAAGANAIDDKHPRIFPWAAWRERNDKWLSNPSDDHCDPRNRHVPRKGESECYPPSNVQLAALVISAHSAHDPAITIFTLDRGDLASVNADYYISILDADDRPATKWVHPSRIQQQSTQIELPHRIAVSIKFGETHAAVVEHLSSDDQFPEDDPRRQP